MSPSGSMRMSRTRSLTMTTRTTWADSVVLVVTPVALETLTSPSLVVLTPLPSVRPLVKVVSVPTRKVKAKTYDNPFLEVLLYLKLI